MISYRLTRFECGQDRTNQKYQIPDKFLLERETPYGRNTYFNVAKALANDTSYEEFVSQLLALTDSSDEDEDEEEDEGEDEEENDDNDGDEASTGKRRSESKSFTITLNEESFLCGGRNDWLEPTDDGWALDQEEEEQRVVFVPSKSRSAPGKSCLHQIARALGESSRCILVVPFAELDDYVATHSDDWLVVAPCDTTHDTIGDARRCVLTIAGSLGLKRVWMIDDSVPAQEICRSEQALRKEDTGERWQEPKAKRSPGHIVPFNDALAMVEAFAADQVETGFHLALVGIPSTWSLENATTSYPLFNKRAPTSFVYVLLDQLPTGVTYDRRLPYKEDIIFAAQTVNKRATVCIYRELHFEDTRYSTGGCSMYHGNELC